MDPMGFQVQNAVSLRLPFGQVASPTSKIADPFQFAKDFRVGKKPSENDRITRLRETPKCRKITALKSCLLGCPRKLVNG